MRSRTKCESAPGPIRATALGPSAMLTTSMPASWSMAAPSTARSAPTPFGGSSSTDTQNFPPKSRRANSDRSAGGTGGSVGVSISGARTAAGVATGVRMGAIEDKKFRISLMVLGHVPQQPPMMHAPACAVRLAYSAMYSGPARYNVLPSTICGKPALGMAEMGSWVCRCMVSTMSRTPRGPFEQLVPIASTDQERMVRVASTTARSRASASLGPAG